MQKLWSIGMVFIALSIMLVGGISQLNAQNSGSTQLDNGTIGSADQWVTSGYTGFAAGEFGNGGQNIYVSKSGILQRIHRFDFNADGWADILFVNSHDYNETPSSYVCNDVFGKLSIMELPGLLPDGGAIGDVNDDGFDDFVIANSNNGAHFDVTSYLYYGSRDGLSERYTMEFPVPHCSAAAIGDFDGNGGQDIAFSIAGSRLRVFPRVKSGYLPNLRKDINVDIAQMMPADLDKDGYCDLYTRLSRGAAAVFWGSTSGLDTSKKLMVREFSMNFDYRSNKKDRDIINARYTWQPKVINLNGTPYLFAPGDDKFLLYPVKKDRSLGTPTTLNCSDAVAVTADDINGDGYKDLAVAVCNSRKVRNDSYIYWGSPRGFSNNSRTAFSTLNAVDITTADLDMDGCADVAIAQGESSESYDTESLVFKGGKKGLSPNPVRIKTNGCRAVLAGRTTQDKKPQLIFVNNKTGRMNGDVNAFAYYGGPNGFSVDRRAELPSRSAAHSLCYDYNDDGKADLFICNIAEDAPHLDVGSLMYIGGDDGLSAERQEIIPTKLGYSAVTGDFRHTGYLDLITAAWKTGEMLVFEGKDGGFSTSNPQQIMMGSDLSRFTREDGIDTPQNSEEFQEPRSMFTADFNNDSWLDIFVPQIYGTRSFIMWGGKEGFSMNRTTALAAEGISCANAADLDGDGWLDLVLGGYYALSKSVREESYVYIYWGGQEGYSNERRTMLSSYASGGIAIVDFNKDGVLDIFTTNYHAGRIRDIDSYIFWGKPGGLYSAHNRSRLFCHSASGCIAADFNMDGWTDLAVANHRAYGNHNTDSFVFWNGPSGFSEDRLTKLPTTGPHFMLPVDTGNLMNRQPEEYYVSSAFQLPSDATVTSISWEAELQNRTWVKAQLRFAQNPEELENASWQGPSGSNTWFENGQGVGSIKQSGRWVQYRLALGADNGGNTPRVSSVTVDYK